MRVSGGTLSFTSLLHLHHIAPHRVLIQLMRSSSLCIIGKSRLVRCLKEISSAVVGWLVVPLYIRICGFVSLEVVEEEEAVFIRDCHK